VSTRMTVLRSCRPLRLRTVSWGGRAGRRCPATFLKRPPQRLMISFVVNSADVANKLGSESISTKSEGTCDEFHWMGGEDLAKLFRVFNETLDDFDCRETVVHDR
jgi:hypothetical protein